MLFLSRNPFLNHRPLTIVSRRLYQSSLHRMSDIKGYPFHLRLDMSEINLFYKISMDQFKRWDKIIGAEEEDSPIAEDYQYDSLHLRDMLDDLEKHMVGNSYPNFRSSAHST